MRVLIIESKHFCRVFKIGGIALAFVIIVHDKNNKTLINHELVHITQWRELWYVVFLPWYLLEHYRKGYQSNRFEKEAYANQHDLSYLATREKYAFLRY